YGSSGGSVTASMRERGDGALAGGGSGGGPARSAPRAAGDGEADGDTLARLARGEAGAFAALFRRYYDALCSFAQGLVESADDAAVVVTDVFSRLRVFLEHTDSSVHRLYYMCSF